MRRIFGLAVLVLALAHSVGRADDSPPAFRLGGGTGVFSYTSGSNNGTHNEVFSVGILSPSIAIDLGAQVAPWLALGVLGGVGYSTYPQSGSLSGFAQTSYSAVFYVEASFRAEFARPFLRLLGGFQGAEADVSVIIGATTTHSSSSLIEGVIGGALGTHCFATPDFSVSPLVSFQYAAGGSHTMSGATDTSFGAEGVTVQLGLELLGWID